MDYFRSLIDQYFGVTYDVELKCVEAEDEPPTKSAEQYLQLSCFISQDVKYMLSGLKSVSFKHKFYFSFINENKVDLFNAKNNQGICPDCFLVLLQLFFTIHNFLLQKMQEQITKMSPSLQRDAVYTKTVLKFPKIIIISPKKSF